MENKDKFLLMGHVVGLLSQSAIHSRFPISSLNQVFIPPISLNQFRIYYKDGNLPMGLVTWACLSDEINELYNKGDYQLKAADWNSGQNLWITDLVVPFGHMKQVVKDMRENIFPQKKGYFMRMNEQGEMSRVRKWHGKKI